MDAIYRVFPNFTDNEHAILADVGSGLCRPQLQAALCNGVITSYGIEICPNKCAKALAFVDVVSKKLGCAFEGLHIICMHANQLKSLCPATHVFVAWEGWNPADKEDAARVISKSTSVQYVCLVQRWGTHTDPNTLGEMGFTAQMSIVQQVKVKLLGGGGTLDATIFRVVRHAPGGSVSACDSLSHQPQFAPLARQPREHKAPDRYGFP
jgi:hypothetical protein